MVKGHKRVEGELTDAIVRGIKEGFGKRNDMGLVEILVKLDDLVEIGIIEPRESMFYLELYKKNLSHLYFFDLTNCGDFLKEYNSIQIKRRDIPPSILVEGFLIIDEKYLSLNSTYGYLLNDLIVSLDDEKSLKVSSNDAKYLCVLERFAKANLNVAEGYINHYNELQNTMSRNNNFPQRKEIVGVGHQRYDIVLEKRI